MRGQDFRENFDFEVKDIVLKLNQIESSECGLGIMEIATVSDSVQKRVTI